MGNGSKFNTSCFAKSYGYEDRIVDYNLVPPHPGYPCRVCLTYFDIKDMELNDRGYSRGICKDCHSKYLKEWNVSEAKKASQKKWLKSNPEYMKEYMREYYKRKKEAE